MQMSVFCYYVIESMHKGQENTLILLGDDMSHA